jgi:hypothetical protein
MPETPFDIFSYIRSAPVVSLESGILLANTLVAVMPKSMPAIVKKAATKLSRVADDAQSSLAQRQREQMQSLEESNREIDTQADQLWTLLRGLLELLSRLPEKYERSKKAKRLLVTLFSEGIAFLQLPYGEQFVTMDTLLRRIDSEDLAKTIDAVVGPELLQEIRAIHPRYQAMVARRLKEAAPAASFKEHVRLLQRAILEYATAVATTVDSDDDSTIGPAREALRPIDNHRDQQTPAKSPEPADPEAPRDPGNPSEPAPAPVAGPSGGSVTPER